jgi:hypothetical protein
MAPFGGKGVVTSDVVFNAVAPQPDARTAASQAPPGPGAPQRSASPHASSTASWIAMMFMPLPPAGVTTTR